jgi:hypothetical protein
MRRQKGKSEGKRQSGRTEGEIEAGRMGRFQAQWAGETKSALFRAHRTG